MNTKNKLIGVPMQYGANRIGIEFGIELLCRRYPELLKDIEMIEVERKEEDFSNKNLRHKNTILDTCEKLAKVVHQCIREGKRPVVIGGDHSIALGSIAGVTSEKEIGVVWIDAHGDMNTEITTLSGNIHGMPLALSQGLGDRELVDCYYKGKKIDSKNVVILGARDLDIEERQLIDKQGIKVISSEEIFQKGIDRVLEDIKDYLKVENLHISFDIDSIDPILIPGVSTPVDKGLSIENIERIFRFLLTNYSITSVDLVEFNPENDIEDKTLNFMKQMIEYLSNVE